ncbi:MAG: hypothetical protein V3V88_01105 [Dehalococcoidia bacterium]
MAESERIDELKKLANIAADMTLSRDLRTKAIESLKNIGTHEALLVLLNLAANENLNVAERDLALKKAREIVKSSR